MGISSILILLQLPSRRLGERRATEAASHHLQVDLPYASSDFDIQGDFGVAVGVVDVRVALPAEALGVYLAQAALGPHPHPAWQKHRCLAYPALYAGVKTLSVIAGQVHRCLPSSHLEVEPRQGKAVQIQVALPCAHLHHEIGGYRVVEAQVPLVSDIAAEADALAATALLDAQFARITTHVVADLWFPV